jgi:hypothetical protein
VSGLRESLNKLQRFEIFVVYQQHLGPSPPYPLLTLSTWRPSRRPLSRQSLARVMMNRRTEWRGRRRAASPLTKQALSFFNVKCDCEQHDSSHRTQHTFAYVREIVCIMKILVLRSNVWVLVVERLTWLVA